jgi:hypothetical protein
MRAVAFMIVSWAGSFAQGSGVSPARGRTIAAWPQAGQAAAGALVWRERGSYDDAVISRAVTRDGRFVALAMLLALAPAAPVEAQVFFSSQPASKLAIGPLIVRASITPAAGPVPVEVLWGVILPPGRPAADVAQDLYLLWPGEVHGDGPAAPGDPALTRHVEERGFDVIGAGRLSLAAQSLVSESKVEPVAGGAPFVTFVQSGGALGLSAPATFVRIPWHPKMAERGWLMGLGMRSSGLLKPKTQTWLEALFLERRYVASLGFHEVRDRPLFPMYVDHRDRLIRLASEPAELVMNFASSDQLQVDSVFPQTSIRRLSDSLESTQVVSVFIDTSEGVTPQTLTVQFGYFSRLQAWMLVVVPLVFFGLGHAVGPLFGRAALALTGLAARRIHWGAWNQPPRQQDDGVVIGGTALARIVPGATRHAEVVALCGRQFEELERLGEPGQRTLIYRGRRVRPRAHRVWGWLTTVREREVEDHEVRVDLRDDVVSHVEALVRRSTLTTGRAP